MSYLIHLGGLCATAVVCVVVGWWVNRRTDDRAGTAMTVLLVLHATMAALVAGGMVAPSPAQPLWYHLYQLVSLVVPVAWLVMAIYYTGRDHWLTKPVWASLAVAVGVPAVLMLTEPVHGLMVEEYASMSDPFAYLLPVFTELGFVVWWLTYVFYVFALGLFVQLLLFSRPSIRRQAATVVVGLGVILLTGTVSWTGVVPAPGFPYPLYGGGVFAAIISVALFRTRMFAVLPLARDATFEALEDAVVVVDAGLHVVDYNGAATELFPDIDGQVDRPLGDAYPALVDADGEADGGGADAIVEAADGTFDSPFAGSVRVADASGTRTLRVSVSEIASGGEPRGYALIMRDVTDLEEYATELEHKTDRLEQFASVLSHDLRNPLSVASGYVGLARETGDLGHLGEAETALQRIDDTIDNLLALSREGETISDPAVVALRPLVSEAWETSDTAGAVLDNAVGDDCRVRTDPARLRTLFENLFRNAAEHGSAGPRSPAAHEDAAEHGGVTVTVGESGSGFFVADDGPGIPADERERVFEYGYSTTPEGTGLGLAIVSSIAAAHGWSLSVSESEDGGVRFEFDGVDRP